jgi:membrane-associated protease RseP (regulator of RpoE activity)
MWKMLGLVAIGLAVGAGAVLYSRPDAASGTLLVAGTDAPGIDVQKSLAALDRRVKDLTAEVEALRDARGAIGVRPQGENGPPAEPGADWPPFGEGRNPADRAAMRERVQQRELERFTAAGFTPERVQWINRRTEELRVAAMQAQYEAQRTGQRFEGMDVEQALRKEMGDQEYERYLGATGRPTEVRVMNVLATSAAERAGLKAGDEILSYGGTRVFDTRELNSLTMQGAQSGAVTVEVRRDGQTMQVSVPRGPLGVTAPGGGRQGGLPGGGPGGGGPGFRGDR